MVGLGRVELPTNGLGIGQLFLNLYVFSAFSSVNFVLFWAQSVAEHATDLATLAETSLHYQYQYHMIARYPRAAREARFEICFSPPILFTYSWCAGRFRVVSFSLRVTSSLCAISGLSHREQKALQAIPPLLEKVHGLPER